MSPYGQELLAVAVESWAFAIAQTGAHASSPVGHEPSTQTCAAPGSPLTPAQSHCQQPQSLDTVQA